jgi:hypothetical protein
LYAGIRCGSIANVVGVFARVGVPAYINAYANQQKRLRDFVYESLVSATDKNALSRFRTTVQGHSPRMSADQ